MNKIIASKRSDDYNSEMDSSYYQYNYSDYEGQTSDEKIQFYLDLLDQWLPKNECVFELGTGLGHFIQAASQHYQCSGCDINSYGVTQTHKKVPGLTIHKGSYECIPSQGINAVVAWDVLEHVPDLDKALSVIHERLASNGFLFAMVPVYDGPFGWLVHLLDKDPTHVSKYSRWTWQKKLEDHNFKIQETGGVLRRFILNRYYLHISKPKSLLKLIGWGYYFVAQKR